MASMEQSRCVSASLRKPEVLPLPIYDPAFKANPYLFYSQLRRDGRDLAWVELPNGIRAWLVVGFEASRSLLSDPRLSRDSSFAGADFHRRHPTRQTPLFQHLLTFDPPTHTRLRALVQRDFTKRNIDALRPRITLFSEELLSAITLKSKFDLIEDFARPLPLRVICEILGTPMSDEHVFRRWSALLTTADADEQDLAQAAGAELREYLLNLAAVGPRQQSLFGLLVSRHRAGELTIEELVGMGFLLLVAGHETTVNLIGNGALALLADGQAWRKLAQGELPAAAVVEELLRAESPLEVSTPLFAREPISLGDETIECGDTVFISYGAANRDDRLFQRPEMLDFGREKAQQHLAFGHGIHHCLGARLARTEGEIALHHLARCFPDLALDCHVRDLVWRPGLYMRGLRALPLITGI